MELVNHGVLNVRWSIICPECGFTFTCNKKEEFSWEDNGELLTTCNCGLEFPVACSAYALFLFPGQDKSVSGGSKDRVVEGSAIEEELVATQSCAGVPRKKVVYLANPYGFSSEMRAVLLPRLVAKIESLGYEVWEPFDRNGTADFSDPVSAYKVGQSNLKDILDSDIFFGVVNGNPPEEDTMVGLGIAIASGMEIYLFRDDFRRSSGSYPLNLMLFMGMSLQGWKKRFFTSLAEIDF